jgi:hypothetical protein
MAVIQLMQWSWNIFITLIADKHDSPYKGLGIRSKLLKIKRSKMVIARMMTICLFMFLAGCNGKNCDTATVATSNYNYPLLNPLCIVESDPKVHFLQHWKDLKPTPLGKILIIPIYSHYRCGDTMDSVAIAHPFLYQQGEDIEKQLVNFGQRDKLLRLVAFIHGYFPIGIRGVFRNTFPVQGKVMDVFDIQPYVDNEEAASVLATLNLLSQDQFVVGDEMLWKKTYPYSDSPTCVDERYDFNQLTKAIEYPSRYYQYGTNIGFVFWGCDPGTRVINRLSTEDRAMVREYFKAEKRS